MKRILLFVLTNFAVMAVLLITTRILGVDRFLTANGLNMTALAGFSLVIGFGGAIISLLISKPMAKFSTGARVINQPQNADEAWIVQTVQNFASKAGIGMPEVAIYDGAPNAFATGAFKNSALVAVSTGLLQSMTAGRAGHENLQSLHYGYDPVGNILHIEDAAQPVRFFSNQRVEPVSRYTYDTLYQLIEATGREVNTGASHGPAIGDRLRELVITHPLQGIRQVWGEARTKPIRTMTGRTKLFKDRSAVYNQFTVVR